MLSISFRPKKTKSHQTAHYIPVWVAAFLSSPALCLRTSRTESLHLPPPHPGAHPRASSPSPPLAQREKSLAQLWVLSLQEPLHFLFSRGCLRRMASWTMYSGAKWAASSPPNQLALHLNNLGYLERGPCTECLLYSKDSMVILQNLSQGSVIIAVSQLGRSGPPPCS